MVWPALLAVAGYGAQAYGSQQKTDAMRNAERANRLRNSALMDQSDRDTTALLREMGLYQDRWDQGLNTLVDDMSADNRVSAFRAGDLQSRAGIDKVLSVVNAQNPTGLPGAAENGLGAWQAGEQARVAGRTDDAADMASIVGGIHGMGLYDADRGEQFSNRARDLAGRIRDAMRVYQYGEALRGRQQQRISGAHAADLAAAQAAGNTAILMGGVAQTGATAASAYGLGQPTDASAPPTAAAAAAGYSAGGGSGYNAPSWYPRR